MGRRAGPRTTPLSGDILTDADYMRRAIDAAQSVRAHTTPNPWVGCVIVCADGTVVTGATQPPGGRHAEAVALAEAGPRAVGATVFTTLEPCSHHGRTPPCADALHGKGADLADLDPGPLRQLWRLQFMRERKTGTLGLAGQRYRYDCTGAIIKYIVTKNENRTQASLFALLFAAEKQAPLDKIDLIGNLRRPIGRRRTPSRRGQSAK